MKTLCKKSFGVFLAVLMLLSAVGVGSYSVFAANTNTEKSGATSASGDTVYFQNTGNWSKVNAYMWYDGKSNANNKAWPGEAMTLKANTTTLSSITVAHRQVILFTLATV